MATNYNVGISYEGPSGATFVHQWDTYKFTETLTADQLSGDWVLKVNSDYFKVNSIPNGYSFDGWYVAPSGSYTSKDAVKAATTNKISGQTALASVIKSSGYYKYSLGTTLTVYYYGLRAKIIPIIFTVQFNPNGGTVSPSSATGSAESPITLPTPELIGNSCTGWYTELSGGTKVGNPGESYYPTSASTLYAQWIANTYTVTFNPVGGTVSPSTKTVTYGEEYGTLPTPTKTDARFAGWFTQESGGNEIKSTDVVTILNNTTLFAHWNNKTYVVFDTNGGNTITGDTYKTLFEGDTFGALPTTTRQSDGDIEYTFSGWFTAETGGMQIYASTAYTNSMGNRIYAHWNDNLVTITFDAQNGIVSPTSAKYVKGKQYGYLPTPICARLGPVEDFNRWISGSTTVTVNSIVPNVDTTLIAQFDQPILRGIIRYVNPISGEVVEDQYEEESIYYNIRSVYSAFPSFIPPSGMTFNTSSAWINYATGDVYAENSRPRMPSGTITVMINLIGTNVVVTLDSQGGTVSPSVKTIAYGQPIGVLPVPTKSGKHFNGWFTQQSEGTKISQKYIVTHNMTIYAQWRGQNVIKWSGATVS